MGAPHDTPYNRVMRRTNTTTNGCVVFTGYRNPQGYGRIRVEGRGKLTHRVIWEYHRGQVPKGHDVCHSCDNPSCVNIDHLFLGTRDDNMKDAARKGRVRKGVAHHNAKLTGEDVLSIRERAASGQRSLRGIARDYGVAYATVYDVISGATWSHIKGS